MHVDPDGLVINRFTPQSDIISLEELLSRRVQPTTSAAAIRRRAALEVGVFFEGYRRAAGIEDIDMWWRIATRHECLAHPMPLVRYLVRDDRNQSRPRAELKDLQEDVDLLIARIGAAVSGRLRRRAAPEFQTMMARSWCLAGSRHEGFVAAIRSLRYRPTLNGLTTAGFGALPARCSLHARQGHRGWIRNGTRSSS